MGVSGLVALSSWAVPKLIGFLSSLRGRSAVHAGKRATGLDDFERLRQPKEDIARVFAGRWSLDSVIGRGGMGRVFAGTDRKTGRRVAIKMIEVTDPETRKILRDIFLSEARALALLHHPNVVDFIEAAPDGDAVALVFELVAGKTVQQMIAEDKRLDWEVARTVFVGVARALAAAHACNLVHRDLKPANIMVTNDGVVKVMDFGVARLMTPDPHAPTAPLGLKREERPIVTMQTTSMSGTPPYMPPEALHGIITLRGDLFSTGACLYEALSGQLPYGGNGWSPATDVMRRPLAALVPGISPKVDILLDELLQPDPERRLKDAQTLEQRLLVI